MQDLTLLCILILVILVVLYIRNCSETFEIEPNTIMGGYNSGPQAFELDGPGYPDGY